MQKIMNFFPLSTGKLDVLWIHFYNVCNKPPVTNIPEYPLKSSQHCSMVTHTGNCGPHNIGTHGPILANKGTHGPILANMGTHEQYWSI